VAATRRVNPSRYAGQWDPSWAFQPALLQAQADDGGANFARPNIALYINNAVEVYLDGVAINSDGRHGMSATANAEGNVWVYGGEFRSTANALTFAHNRPGTGSNLALGSIPANAMTPRHNSMGTVNITWADVTGFNWGLIFGGVSFSMEELDAWDISKNSPAQQEINAATAHARIVTGAGILLRQRLQSGHQTAAGQEASRRVGLVQELADEVAYYENRARNMVRQQLYVSPSATDLSQTINGSTRVTYPIRFSYGYSYDATFDMNEVWIPNAYYYLTERGKFDEPEFIRLGTQDYPTADQSAAYIRGLLPVSTFANANPMAFVAGHTNVEAGVGFPIRSSAAQTRSVNLTNQGNGEARTFTTPAALLNWLLD